MRISELSERADLPVGTIKFYLRTKLLHQGELVSATQAEYDQTHIARLRLIRALLEVGRLSHAEIQAVLESMAQPAGDDPETVLGAADATARIADEAPADLVPARRAVQQLGWSVSADSPHVARLARAIEALDAVGLPPSAQRLQHYGQAALAVAERDLEWVLSPDADDAKLRAVGSAVLWSQVLGALRMLAAEHLCGTPTEPALVRPRRPESANRFPAQPHDGSTDGVADSLAAEVGAQVTRRNG